MRVLRGFCASTAEPLVRFELTIFCAQGRRIPRLSYTLIKQSAQRELNPRFRHGKAAGYRYIMGACGRIDCQRSRVPDRGTLLLAVHGYLQSTRWDSNPRRCITGAASSPLDYQCLLPSVGSEGLEPSLSWLRARRAAANTLIPCLFCSVVPFCAHLGRGGSRTLVRSL